MCYQSKKARNLIFIFSLTISLIQIFEVKYIYAGFSDEQKKLIKTEFFGDYTQAKIKKVVGKVTLVVWEPHIQKLERAGFTAIIPQNKSMTINYDEIWEKKFTELLTKEEIKKWWNDLDIGKLYWKNGKVQAAVVLKKYIENPITNERFTKGEYKITDLFSRNEILQKAK